MDKGADVKAAIIILGLALLSACDADKPRTGDEIIDDASVRYAREHPVGAFQMMSNPGGEGLILLDTRTGILKHCASARASVACGEPANLPK